MTRWHMPSTTSRDTVTSSPALRPSDSTISVPARGPDAVGRFLANAMVVSLLAVLPSGRMELAAETQRDARRGAAPWAVTMADGVVVELVGVSRCPSKGEPWWEPDGARLTEAPRASGLPYTPPRSTSLADAFEFAVRVSNSPEGWSAAGPSVVPSLSQRGNAVSWEIEGVPGHNRRATALVPQTHDRCAVWLRVPNGEWVTVASTDGRRETTVDTPHGQVVFREAQPKEVNTIRKQGHRVVETVREVQGIAIAAAVKGPKAAHRIAAIDKRGRTQFAGAFHVATPDGEPWMQGHFPTLGIDDVAEFRLLRCPFEWIVFRNVALQPGQKTKVQVIKTDHDPKELLREIVWQTQSAERVPMLCYLGWDRGRPGDSPNRARRYWTPAGKPVDFGKIRHVVEEVAPAPQLGPPSGVPALQLWFRYNGGQKDLDHFRVRPTLCAQNHGSIPTDIAAADLKRDPATGHRWAACSLRPRPPSKWDDVAGIEEITFPIEDWRTLKTIEQFGDEPQQIHTVIEWSCGSGGDRGKTVLGLVFQWWTGCFFGGRWQVADMDGETVSGRDVLHTIRPPLRSICGKPLRHELFRQIVIDKNGRDITPQALRRITAKTQRGIRHQEYFDVNLSDIARVQIQARRLASLPMRDAGQRTAPDLAALMEK